MIDRVPVHTADGAELFMPLAGVGSRILAGLLDLMLLGVIWLFAGLLAYRGFSMSDLYGALGLALLVLFIFASFWGYGIFFETIMQGRTPGKKALGLRVIRDDGFPVGPREIWLRNLLRMADLQPGISYGLGICWMFFDKKDRRLGDLVAGTIVVRDALVTSKTTRAGAAWAARAEEGRAHQGLKLPGGTLKVHQLDLIEQFLSRLPELSEERGEELALRVIQPVTEFMDEGMKRRAEVRPISVLRELHELSRQQESKPATFKSKSRSLF